MRELITVIFTNTYHLHVHEKGMRDLGLTKVIGV